MSTETLSNAESSVDTEASEGLRVLFNVGHPAQVHLFRHAISELEAAGNETLVASRHKEMTTELLDAFGIEHEPLTKSADSLPGLLFELVQRERRLFSVARDFEPDVVVTRLAPAPVHVSRLVGAKNVVVCDTLATSTVLRKLMHSVTVPFVDTICMPSSFDMDVPPENRRSVSFQELAYLHPRYFTPDPSVLTANGIDPQDSFFVLRLVDWDAYHDVGHEGLSPALVEDLVSFLSDHGDVYVSAEGDVPERLDATPLKTPPEHVHHVLYYADLYVGDSGTMSAEAAMLGTPAIRTNAIFDGTQVDVFRELEDEYGLLRSFDDEDAAVAAAKEIVRDPPDQRVLRQRRTRLVEEQPDVTATILEAIRENAATEADQNV